MSEIEIPHRIEIPERTKKQKEKRFDLEDICQWCGGEFGGNAFVPAASFLEGNVGRRRGYVRAFREL